MNKIFIIGDIHTVSVFRMAGIEPIEADEKTAPKAVRELSDRNDVPIIIVTRELADTMPDLVRAVNLRSSGPVIIEIPGIDDPHGFGKSAMDYITEALGISV